MYGGLGATATFLFFMYFVGRLVVTAPVLSSALHAELREHGAARETDGDAEASPG